MEAVGEIGVAERVKGTGVAGNAVQIDKLKGHDITDSLLENKTRTK
jgi:hypothetical protein